MKFMKWINICLVIASVSCVVCIYTECYLSKKKVVIDGKVVLIIRR